MSVLGSWVLATKIDPRAGHLVFLRERYGSGARITLPRQGEWSAAYAVRTADADLVVRFSRYDEDFEKDAYAARYSSAALPIPAIIECGRPLAGFHGLAPSVRTQ